MGQSNTCSSPDQDPSDHMTEIDPSILKVWGRSHAWTSALGYVGSGLTSLRPVRSKEVVVGAR